MRDGFPARSRSGRGETGRSETMGTPRPGRSTGKGLLLALGVLLAGSLSFATVAHAKPPLIQKRYLRIITGSSLTVTFKKPNTAGNLIVAYVVWDNGGTVSLSDTAGNTYVSAIGPTQSNGASAQIFYAADIAAGLNAVTTTFAAPITTRGTLYLHEYSGVDRTAPLEAAVAASGTSLDMDSGPLTTAHANALLFVGAESDKSVNRRDKTWKTRARRYGNMTADKVALTPGTYNAIASQKGTAWIMQLVSFKAPGGVGPPPSSVYPLKVSANGRYLVDQNNTPFLITGDSPQALMVNLSEAEADSFFADRQAAGFNLVWINLLCASYTGGRPDGSTYDGIVPFTTPGDLSTPNEAYFSRIDDMLNLAAQHGLVVLLDPAETGSFLSLLLSNGVAKARDYGR